MGMLKCINKDCKHQGTLTEDDFYWHDRDSKTLKNKKCKYCLRAEANKKNELKRQEKQLYPWI